MHASGGGADESIQRRRGLRDGRRPTVVPAVGNGTIRRALTVRPLSTVTLYGHRETTTMQSANAGAAPGIPFHAMNARPARDANPAHRKPSARCFRLETSMLASPGGFTQSLHHQRPMAHSPGSSDQSSRKTRKETFLSLIASHAHGSRSRARRWPHARDGERRLWPRKRPTMRPPTAALTACGAGQSNVRATDIRTGSGAFQRRR